MSCLYLSSPVKFVLHSIVYTSLYTYKWCALIWFRRNLWLHASHFWFVVLWIAGCNCFWCCLLTTFPYYFWSTIRVFSIPSVFMMVMVVVMIGGWEPFGNLHIFMKKIVQVFWRVKKYMRNNVLPILVSISFSIQVPIKLNSSFADDKYVSLITHRRSAKLTQISFQAGTEICFHPNVDIGKRFYDFLALD